MILPRNNVLVESEGYKEALVFNLDRGASAYKLSVQALSENPFTKQFEYGPVICQITEEPQHLYDDDYNNEMFLELGFNSRGFATPITGARFRIPRLDEGVPAVKPAKLHIVFYG